MMLNTERGYKWIAKNLYIVHKFYEISRKILDRH